MVQQGNHNDRVLRRVQNMPGIAGNGSSQIVNMVDFLGIIIDGVTEYKGKLHFSCGDDSIFTVKEVKNSS